MTPEEGYERAKHHRVGTVIVMGPECAIERRVKPVSDFDKLQMGGDRSFAEYDLRKWNERNQTNDL